MVGDASELELAGSFEGGLTDDVFAGLTDLEGGSCGDLEGIGFGGGGAAAVGGGRLWYTLVRLDPDGHHMATDEETAELAKMLFCPKDPLLPVTLEVPGVGGGVAALEPNAPLVAGTPATSDDSARSTPTTVSQHRAGACDPAPAPAARASHAPAPRGHHQKPGGPCDHCGALESPQWRRGPASKPMLCNACGTRYRRTNQLQQPISRTVAKGGGKRASPPESPTSTLLPVSNNSGKRTRHATDTDASSARSTRS
mmetsp:Transcript_21263/g.68852  ORF Transcript_21263/g.68852 Transcript_21263/m.68852 type:complete len:255 (+) Transcript_21263:249-1013(+)